MAKILLVDDNDSFRQILGLMLRELGHEVAEASNGVEAWVSFKAHPADLVIMDLIMPDKEGLETILEFKRKDVAIKILAISGGGKIDTRDMLFIAEQFGANHVLAKPFSKKDLVAALTRLLSAEAWPGNPFEHIAGVARSQIGRLVSE